MVPFILLSKFETSATVGLEEMEEEDEGEWKKTTTAITVKDFVEPVGLRTQIGGILNLFYSFFARARALVEAIVTDKSLCCTILRKDQQHSDMVNNS